MSSTCATRQDLGASEILAIGIAFPSLVANALFLCLDDRRISEDFCSGVALMSFRFAAGLSGDGDFSSRSVSDNSEMDFCQVYFQFFLRAPFSRWFRSLLLLCFGFLFFVVLRVV